MPTSTSFFFTIEIQASFPYYTYQNQIETIYPINHGTNQFFFVHPLQMRVDLISIFPLENRYSILLYPLHPQDCI